MTNLMNKKEMMKKLENKTDPETIEKMSDIIKQAKEFMHKHGIEGLAFYNDNGEFKTRQIYDNSLTTMLKK